MTKKNLFSRLLSIFCLVIVTFVSTSIVNAQVPGNVVPNWVVGTFYGRNVNGDTITLTINNHGRVVDHVIGITSYGTISGNTLTFDGAAPRRIIQSNNGFTTVQNNGQRIDFSRSGGGGNSGGGGGQEGNVPNWAIGTFYAPSPDGYPLTLMITDDGRVVSHWSGQISYGTMSGNTLTIGGTPRRVTQLGNGISTFRNDNGKRIDYSRGGSGGNSGGGGGQEGNIPNWAIGTFYAPSPDGDPLTITITNDGRVTTQWSGHISYGTISGKTINIGGTPRQLSRSGNGISTFRPDNGKQINYSRQ